MTDVPSDASNGSEGSSASSYSQVAVEETLSELEATEKFKSSADAMDECGLPYVVLPAWREASSPWPMPLARSHQDVQDSMWLLESVARTTAAAMYEHVGKSADDLHRTLDSPLFEVNGESIILAWR